MTIMNKKRINPLNTRLQFVYKDDNTLLNIWVEATPDSDVPIIEIVPKEA